MAMNREEWKRIVENAKNSQGCSAKRRKGIMSENNYFTYHSEYPKTFCQGKIYVSK
jgi:hypothetical protein